MMVSITMPIRAKVISAKRVETSKTKLVVREEVGNMPSNGDKSGVVVS